MSKIRILPEQLANQIAAGEVVERPSSVVKELIENSLDAGANRIEIDVEGAGTRLIRIIDNGEGMGEDDLLMSIERHGTSKILTEKDLGAIGTLGFRGEAIPSIGSVSQLTMTSRPAKTDLGTRVTLKYGRLIKVHDIGCSLGTTVEVRNLFGNTPARRKFLKTARTELGHIDEAVKDYALASPDVAFILRVNGKDTLCFDTTQTVEQRLAHIMRYHHPLIPIGNWRKPPLRRQVFGFLVPPEDVTATSSKLRIFVNGRAVRDRMIAHGVGEGLRGFLMKGRSAAGLIHLTLPLDEVDVNVHPAKHEVRFRSSRDVHALLSREVSEAMRQYQQSVRIKIFGKALTGDRSAMVPAQSGQDDQASSPAPGYPPLKSPSFDSPRPLITAENGEDATAADDNSPSEMSHLAAGSAAHQPLFVAAEPMRQSHRTEKITPEHPYTDTPYPLSDDSKNLLVIGQYSNLYIFCKSSQGLVVIDQHAAHERLLYEKFRAQYLAGTVVRQNLMFPLTVELSLFQCQLMEKNSDAIDRMGFTVREFGGSTYIIAAIPALAGRTNPQELFIDILEQFGSENARGAGGGSLDTIIAEMACKAAVKAGTHLSKKEIEKLLDDMAQADLFSHCPHGRPVVKHFTDADIRKWFHRT